MPSEKSGRSVKSLEYKDCFILFGDHGLRSASPLRVANAFDDSTLFAFASHVACDRMLFTVPSDLLECCASLYSSLAFAVACASIWGAASGSCESSPQDGAPSLLELELQ